MENKNILITGGLGFIGSHIINKLIDDNEIVIIDNQSTGSLNNLNNPSHENLKIINQDICKADFDDLTSFIDYIFHLAALANVPLSVENPIKSCEFYLNSFYESYGLNYIALRYFNVFGPKQSLNSQYASVIPNFINAILTNKQPIIYGDGKQTRDFVYIDDVVQANINACESDYNGVVNIASGTNISINELYKLIQEILNSNLEVKHVPDRLGDIKHSHADVSNMEKINLKIDSKQLKKQLENTINWFKTKNK